MLKDQTGVITGAGGTLSSEMAYFLAGRGVKVALLGRDLKKLQKVENKIKSEGGRAISISTDVTDLTAVQRAREIVFEEFGICTILINGAGGNQSEAITTINEFDKKELGSSPEGLRGFFNLDMPLFKNVIETNTMGTVIPCQVFGKDMAANNGGNIINFASMVSFRPLSRVGAYAIAKSGIATFTQCLAAYLAPANILVNAIAPGFFLNDRSRKLLTTPEGGYTDRGANIMRQIPMKHFGEAHELLGIMNFFLDEEISGYVTGTVIPVDGGFLSCPGI
jgi:hypothetical protein